MNKQFRVVDLAYMAVCAALIAICSWISIPAAVPFTMQTFAVFCVLGLLGGKRGTISILVYILLGAVGLPVFAGFSGGIGILFGTTGGYIIGFIFVGLIYWAAEKLFGANDLLGCGEALRGETPFEDCGHGAGACGLLCLRYGVVHACICP